METIDLLVIGGGSAGMAAAIQAKKEGIDRILILEKSEVLGGILNQCIHNGFGLTEFKEELTGPEYLSRFVQQVEDLKIPYKLNTLVTDISLEKVVTFTNARDG
ncbi:MAG: FAD-dependent oxidoreductase, partial [Bacilli bacterium]